MWWVHTGVVSDADDTQCPSLPCPSFLGNHPRRKAGVTLVEMVIASGLLAFVLAGLVVGFTNARRSSVMASDQMKAMHKARQAIEGLSALNFNDAKLAVGTHVLTDLGTSDLFRMSNSYTVALNTNYPSTKDVTVNVFWTTPGRAKVQSITLSSSFTVGLHND